VHHFNDSVDLGGGQLCNFSPHHVAALPAAPFAGQVVFLTQQDGANAVGFYGWDGAAWRLLG
jgi:hypothetical protein